MASLIFGSAAGNLSRIEPMPQLVVRSPLIQSNSPFFNNQYGAIEIKLKARILDTNTGNVISDNTNVRVVQDDMYIANTKSQSSMTWSRVGDDFTINFISPIGMRFYEPRFQ